MNNLWLGLVTKNVGSPFEWVDGTPVSYTRWDTGEPDGSNLTMLGAQIVRIIEYQWASISILSVDQYFSICEKEIGGAFNIRGSFSILNQGFPTGISIYDYVICVFLMCMMYAYVSVFDILIGFNIIKCLSICELSRCKKA